MIRPAALVMLLAFPALAPLALAMESPATDRAATETVQSLVTTKSDRGPTRAKALRPQVESLVEIAAHDL